MRAILQKKKTNQGILSICLVLYAWVQAPIKAILYVKSVES